MSVHIFVSFWKTYRPKHLFGNIMLFMLPFFKLNDTWVDTSIQMFNCCLRDQIFYGHSVNDVQFLQ